MAAFSPCSTDLTKALWLSIGRETRSKHSFMSWFHRFKPDVLLVQNVDTAEWLESIGLNIPQDIPAVLLGKDERARRWAGVSHNGFEIGQEAMKALALKILSHEYGKSSRPPVISIQGDWIPGESLAMPGRKTMQR